MESLYCHICNQGPMPPNQYEQHCNGKNHKKKLYLNGGSMQNDLPDDRRSTKFYSSNVVEQTTVVILDESDDEDVGYSSAPALSSGPAVSSGEDFPALGGPATVRAAPPPAPPTAAMGSMNLAGPTPVKAAPPPAPPTAAVGSMNLGRGRGIGRGRGTNSATPKPGSPQKRSWSNVAVAPASDTPSGTSLPGGDPPRSWSSMAQSSAASSTAGDPPRSWSSMAQSSAPSSTAGDPPRSWSSMAQAAPASEASHRPLTQSERSGNVRVIRQPQALAMPVQGNRPMAKQPKHLTAKRVFMEYKRQTKTASAAVQEIATSLQWILEEEEVMPDPDSFCSFAMRWKVNGKPCDKGQGQKKKIAKEAASRLVLQKYKRLIESQGELDPDDIEANVRPTGDDNRTQLRNMADDYKRLAMTKVDEIVRGSRGSLEKPVRFAAFFITTSPTQAAIDSQLVALGTGRCVSKMTNAEALESCGYILHDMQAPVIARRAFQAFLYGQLSQAMNPTRVIGAPKYGETLLEYNEATGRFQLKPGVRVHLYLSHAPAGDATAFETAAACDEDLTEAELQRDLSGVLEPAEPDRAKGLGRLRVVVDPYRDETAILTDDASEKFPGQKTIVADDSAQSDQKLRVMSMADKLMKWNHVGVQGSLLSLFLDPIFLYSIQVGSGYSHAHAARALLTRVPLSVFPQMPMCYGNADDPFLGRTTQVAKLRNQIEGPVSINWFHGGTGAEVVNCDEGRLSEECSRLSRVTMLMRLDTRWNECLETGNVRHPGLTRRLRSLDSNVKEVNYGELKGFADDYQRAKANVYGGLRNSHLGRWAPKDDLQSFCLRDYEE